MDELKKATAAAGEEDDKSIHSTDLQDALKAATASGLRHRTSTTIDEDGKAAPGGRPTVNVNDFKEAIRGNKSRRMTVLFERLDEADADNDGEIDANELADIIEKAIKEEKKAENYKKLFIGAGVMVIILVLSTFGLSWATAILAKDVSTDGSNTHLTSAKTGENLKTIPEGGGGITVNMELNVNGDGNQRMLHNDFHPEDEDGDVLMGTVPLAQVEAADEGTDSSTKVRVKFTVENEEYHLAINTNSVKKRTNADGIISYSNLFVEVEDDDESGGGSQKHRATVECEEGEEDCKVYLVHGNKSVRHLARHLLGREAVPSEQESLVAFQHQLFGIPPDDVAGESCLGDYENEDATFGVGGAAMKKKVMRVKNPEAMAKMIKEAMPVETRSLDGFAAAFNKAKANSDDHTSDYDLLNNNCLNFGVSFAQALGVKIKSKHMAFVAKRLAENIPDLGSKLLKNPNMVRFAGDMIGDFVNDNGSDYLVQLMKLRLGELQGSADGFLKRNGLWLIFVAAGVAFEQVPFIQKS